MRTAKEWRLHEQLEHPVLALGFGPVRESRCTLRMESNFDARR